MDRLADKIIGARENMDWKLRWAAIISDYEERKAVTNQLRVHADEHGLFDVTALSGEERLAVRTGIDYAVSQNILSPEDLDVVRILAKELDGLLDDR